MAETKKARAKKELSKARAAAMKALKDAVSDQEKTVAKQQLHLVRFNEVAAVRTDAALRALKNLRKCCDTTSYAWTQDQAKKILDAIGPVYSDIADFLKSPGKLKSVKTKFTF